jgi:hypothetical protein
MTAIGGRITHRLDFGARQHRPVEIAQQVDQVREAEDHALHGTQAPMTVVSGARIPKGSRK